MGMDTNGLPTILAVNNVSDGQFNAESHQTQVKQLTGPVQVSVSSIVRSFLDIANAALQIIVDTANRKLVACEADVIADYAGVSGAKILTLKPTAGQSGRSLEFEQDGSETSGFDASTKTAILDLLEPVAPKFSVEALTQRIAAALPEGKQALIAIDQTNGRVKVIMHATHATLQAGSDMATAAEDNAGCLVQLSEPVEGGGSSPLKFEGGEV